MRAIRTDKLFLEPQVVAHAEQMFIVLSDPALYAYENEAPPSLEWLRERFAKLESRYSADGREHWLNWVIALPASRLIGYVQATVYADGHASIAYVLASAYWGRGLGRQAVQAMLTELAEHYRVNIFHAVLKRENRSSLRLLERLGFSLASAALHATHDVPEDEILMRHERDT